MDKIMFKRVVDEGRCMINTGMTVREIANLFDVSKSTVHKDLTVKEASSGYGHMSVYSSEFRGNLLP
jgi:predicted transcriptional regulator